MKPARSGRRRTFGALLQEADRAGQAHPDEDVEIQAGTRRRTEERERVADGEGNGDAARHTGYRQFQPFEGRESEAFDGRESEAFDGGKPEAADGREAQPREAEPTGQAGDVDQVEQAAALLFGVVVIMIAAFGARRRSDRRKREGKRRRDDNGATGRPEHVCSFMGRCGEMRSPQGKRVLRRSMRRQI
jgi:hypothetical protein